MATHTLDELASKISRLDDEQLVQFHVLDKMIFEDEFERAFVPAVVDRLVDGGLSHLGDVVGRTAVQLKAQFGLSEDDIARLTKHISVYGLELGMDTGSWQTYRQSVDADFRLPWSLASADSEQLAGICGRLAEIVRRSPYRHVGPIGRYLKTDPGP